MSKIRKISGFPEWLPEERIVEEQIINTIRSVYNSHGFTSIETPAVELLSNLTNQGVIDKEIYALKRAGGTDDSEAEFGLHFDLTVPFARYVAQHFSELQFPFRRQTLQKVWRGDRPQKGRFREFYQYDIDILVRDQLPIACDAEIITVIDKAYRKLNIAPHKIRINNRKLLMGFYESLGLNEDLQKKAVIAVDKLDKIGTAGVAAELNNCGILGASSEKILKLAETRLTKANFEKGISDLGVSNDLFKLGIEETAALLKLISSEAASVVEIDLSLARGLAYYTGTILEVLLPDHPEFGSAGGGGRYENLTSNFMKESLPAVGASIGITRLVDLVLTKKLIPLKQKCPTTLLVTVLNEEQRVVCNGIADKLRDIDISTEVFYKSPKLGKQIDYASSKGIPYVLFIQDNGVLQVKNLETKNQIEHKSVDTIIEFFKGN